MTTDPTKKDGILGNMPGMNVEPLEQRIGNSLRGDRNFQKQFGTMNYADQMKALAPGPDKPGYPDIGRSIMFGDDQQLQAGDLHLPKGKDDAKYLAKWGPTFAKYKASRTSWPADPASAGIHKWELTLAAKFKHFSVALSGNLKGNANGLKSAGGNLGVDLKLNESNNLNVNLGIDAKPDKYTGFADAKTTVTPGVKLTQNIGKDDKDKKPPNPAFAAGYEPSKEAELEALYKAWEAAMDKDDPEAANLVTDQINAVMYRIP